MYGLEVKGLAANLLRARSIPRQIRFAAARALNDTAWAQRNDMVMAMASAFDRPTPWILRSMWLGKRATAQSLEAWVYPRDMGGKSVDPTNILRPEAFGGERKAKRSELAFRRIGILPAGFAMVPSRALLASSNADAYGNVKGSFIVQLLSYLQAFGEQGYRANMRPERRRQLAKVRRSERGFKQITGVEYFVSHGRGTRVTRARVNGQAQQLPAGIWQRSGTHGADVKPVFLFVRQPRYQARVPLLAVFRATGTREFPRRFAAAVAESTARPSGGAVST